MNQSLFIIHLFTAIFMTGLIWTIQLVHYPSFHFVEREGFATFEAFHSMRISFIVLPVMIIELLTAAALVVQLPELRLFALANLALLGGIWLITFFISAPLHGELAAGYDEAKVSWLVTSNWFRTALWSLRSVGLCFMIKSFLAH
ncbi:MAG: hypothetical protein HRT45_19020 [Bdellovibrionales bacterium]|nr:hypothetical protein [Bdellovibrionales bacterium]